MCEKESVYMCVCVKEDLQALSKKAINWKLIYLSGVCEIWKYFSLSIIADDLINLNH